MAAAQRQHSSVKKSGRTSDEGDEESSCEDDLQREGEHDSSGQERYRDTQARARAPVLTPQGVQKEFASAVPAGSQTVRVWSEDLGKAAAGTPALPPRREKVLLQKVLSVRICTSNAARKVGVQTHPLPL